jgi:hypothetical protein
VQALAGRGIPTGVDLKELKSRRKALDLHLRSLAARAAEVADHAGGDEAGKQHKDDQYHQQLDQRESGLRRRPPACEVDWSLSTQDVGASVHEKVLPQPF